MNSFESFYVAAIAALSISWCPTVSGGTVDVPPSVKNPMSAVAPTIADDWVITASAYGWLAGMEGTTGIKGFKTEVDVPFSKILENLDMTASINLEAQKGRWGGWVDGMYLKASAGGETPDPLFESVNVSVEQIMAEVAVFYRLWQSPRGAFDLYAGARYMSVTGDLSLIVSDSGVEQVSTQLSARVIDEIIRRVRTRAEPVIDAKRLQVANQVAAKASAVLDELHSISQAHPGVIAAIKHSDRLTAAIREAASARIDEQIAVVQGKVAAVKAAARRAVARAEKKLASEIERALRESIPSELSGSKSWVDPFIGARAYYYFTDSLYSVAKADIGGFGISSDLTWQAYAALGYKLSKRASVELGYKYMAVDYTSGDFTNDVRTSGVFLSLGLKL